MKECYNPQGSLGPINIVLATDLLSPPRLKPQSEPFFQENGLSITAEKTHYFIFPGVFELIQHLFSIDNVRISFVHREDPEKSRLFVHALLTRSLGVEKFKAVIDTVTILSSKHFKDPRRPLWGSTPKKWIYTGTDAPFAEMAMIELQEDVVRKAERLENTLSAFPYTSYTAPGEEKNLLYVPPTNEYDLLQEAHASSWERWKQIDKANLPIPCSSYPIRCLKKGTNKLTGCARREILKGENIYITKYNEKFTLYYSNPNSRNVQQVTLDPKNDLPLIKTLNDYHHSHPKCEQGSQEYDLPIQEMIRYVVSGKGGKTRRLRREPIRICYLTGMIDQVIKESQARRLPITEVLLGHQFLHRLKNYKAIHSRCTWNDKVYQSGIKILRSIKPKLAFTPNRVFCSKKNIVLDIDGVLAMRRVPENTRLYFLRKNLILTAVKTWYLVPGALAFIRYLFSLRDTRISFFSSAEERRNQPFAEVLLQRALGKNTEVNVFSRSHLKEPSINERIEQRARYPEFGTGNKMKSLKRVIEEGDEIEDAIIVEDNKSYTTPREENGLLYVPESRGDMFSRGETDGYETEGFRSIPCHSYGYEEPAAYVQEDIMAGKEITIIKIEDRYVIHFLSQHSVRLESVTLDDVEDADLISALNTAQEAEPEFATHRRNYDAAIQEMVHKKVASCGGKTKRIPRKMNRILYVAGMIDHLIKTTSNQDTTFWDALSHYQFRQGDLVTYKEEIGPDKFIEGTVTSYHSLHHQCPFNELFYQQGLAVLRNFDPELTLTTPHSIGQIIAEPPTEEEQQLLTQYKENEASCLLM